MERDHDWLHRISHFARALDLYLDAANELRYLADGIQAGDLKAESVESRFVREAARLFPQRPAENHEPAAKVVHRLVHERQDRIEELGAEATDESRNEFYAEWRAELKERLLELTGDAADYWVYSEVWARVSASRWGSHVLLGSLLTSAIADFEVYFARIVREILEVRPEILTASGRAFTVAELRAFDDIAAVEAFVIGEKVDDIMSGGYASWAEWLLKRGVTVEGATAHVDPRIVEAFECRHVLVHNGASVDSGYVKRVPGTAYKVGEPVRVTIEYLHGVIDLLSTTALKIGFGALDHFFPDDVRLRIEREMERNTFNLLYHGRDRVVVDFESWAVPTRRDEGCRLRAQVNLWLARKRLRSEPSIEAEVDAWDTRPLSGEYRLVRLALLGRLDEAHDLACRLLESGDLTANDFASWPVLEDVRVYDAAVEDPTKRITVSAFESEH